MLTREKRIYKREKKRNSAIQGEFGLSKEQASLTFHEIITQIVDLSRFKEKTLLTDTLCQVNGE